MIIPDHYIFTCDKRANRNLDILREFAHSQGIKYFYDITNLADHKANPDYKVSRAGGRRSTILDIVV